VPTPASACRVGARRRPALWSVVGCPSSPVWSSSSLASGMSGIGIARWSAVLTMMSRLLPATVPLASLLLLAVASCCASCSSSSVPHGLPSVPMGTGVTAGPVASRGIGSRSGGKRLKISCWVLHLHSPRRRVCLEWSLPFLWTHPGHLHSLVGDEWVAALPFIASEMASFAVS